MQAASATNENISPKAMKAIMLEIRDLTKTPIDGVRVVLNEECVTDVQADIDGPGTIARPRPQPPARPLAISRLLHNIRCSHPPAVGRIPCAIDHSQCQARHLSACSDLHQAH